MQLLTNLISELSLFVRDPLLEGLVRTIVLQELLHLSVTQNERFQLAELDRC